MSWITNATNDDFQRARRQALFSRILGLITRSPTDLIPLDEIRARLRIRSQRHLGLRTVRLGEIVGSEGRYSDFDRKFSPRHDNTKPRWVSVNRAYYEDVQLPAVELYKVGGIYFVKDGNHRISVARQRGQQEIDAFVTELVVDVPLGPDINLRDLLIKEEYSDFLSWTRLSELRPDQRVEFSELGGYLVLVRHINAHRYYKTLERGAEPSREEAVVSWYDEVYMPMVQVIRDQGVLADFPGRTEADLYRWIMDHRWYTHEKTGADPGPELAAADYKRLFGRKGLADLTLEFVQRLRGLLPGAGGAGDADAAD